MQFFSFFDLMDGGPPIEVVAWVRFLSTEEGGRRNPVISGYSSSYRPNHNFGGPDNREFYVGQLMIEHGTEIRPGESWMGKILFIHGPGLEDLLVPNREWRIQEGGNLVGHATVVQVSGGA
jgi:elongation factor Tu